MSTATDAKGRKLSLEEWLEQVTRSVARSQPDMYPEGFAQHMAEAYAREGAYEKYLNDKFPEGILYVPAA